MKESIDGNYQAANCRTSFAAMPTTGISNSTLKLDWCRNYAKSHAHAIAMRYTFDWSDGSGYCYISFDSTVKECPDDVMWYGGFDLGIKPQIFRDGSCGKNSSDDDPWQEPWRFGYKSKIFSASVLFKLRTKTQL